MSSDEEDYMSDAFLKQCEDTKPGLLSKQVQRKYDTDQKGKKANIQNKTKSKKQLENENRETGLQTTISSSSKGFALLQKMGYKPGMGIGKKGTGRVEPVPIEVKAGRAGLGRESEMKRKSTEMNNMRAEMMIKRQRAAEKQKTTFLGRMSARFSERNAERDLRTAQKACLQLDQTEGLSEPAEHFFWPVNSLPSAAKPVDKNEEEEEEIEGLQGYSKHVQESRLSDDDSDLETRDEPPAYLDFSASERLDILTRYLRNYYYYCIWCGTRFQNQEDLKSNCPGNSADAHDL